MFLPPGFYKSVISIILAASVLTAEASIKPAEAVKMLCPVAKKGKNANAEEKRQATLQKKLLEIAKGGDINAVDENGQTALMWAAMQDNRLAVYWLVAKGADVMCLSSKKKLAWEYATDREIRKLLNACANLHKKIGKWSEIRMRHLYIQGSRGYGISGDIFSSEDSRMGANLRGTYEGKLIVQYDSSPDVYAFLVRTGYDVNAKDENGETVLNFKTPLETAQLMLALDMKLNPKNPEQMLLSALHRDDTEGAVEVLKKKPELLENAEQIIAATKSGKMVRALIEAGLNVKELRQRDGREISLLEAAIQGGGRVSVVKELLAAECPLTTGEPSLLKLIAKNCPSAGDTAKLLVDAGVSVTDDDLKEAVFDGSLPLVKLALEKGANANQLDKDGRNLLHGLYYSDYRSSNGYRPSGGYIDAPLPKDVGAIGKLLVDAGLKVTDDDLSDAVRARYLPLVKLTLEKGAKVKPQSNLLHCLYGSGATRPYNTDIGSIVRLLIKAGADINHVCDVQYYMHGHRLTIEKATPLHVALLELYDYEGKKCHPFFLPQYEAERERKVKCIADLIKMMKKMPEDILQFVGGVELTPQQCGDIALMLLDKGASIKGEGEKSPLLNAGAFDARVTKRLLDAGLGKNKDELTEALKNARTAEVVDVLLAAGADKNVIGSHVALGIPGCIYPVVKRLLEAGAPTEWVNENGDKCSAMKWLGEMRMHQMQLRDEDYINVAQALLNAGAKIDLFELGDVYFYSDAPLLTTVLKYVPDINAQNAAGNTVMMHWLISKCGLSDDTLMVFLQAGARTDIRNKEGKTILKLALEKKEEICKDPKKLSSWQWERELILLEKIIPLLKSRGAKE